LAQHKVKRHTQTCIPLPAKLKTNRDGH
jgi:hypothetical protein